jgi:hypothetical protein
MAGEVTRRRHARLPGFAFALALAACLAPRGASAEPLTQDERERLVRGEIVRRPLEMELDQGRYVGGVSYAVIHAPPRDVMRALEDVSTYQEILPLTLSAHEVGRRGSDRIVSIVHTTKVGTAQYACLLHKESSHLIRFWLEPSYAHDVEDLWGFFRVEPFGPEQSLFTYGAVMRIELGLARFFFETKIRDYALGTPWLVRRYVEEHRSLGGPAKAD